MHAHTFMLTFTFIFMFIFMSIYLHTIDASTRKYTDGCMHTIRIMLKIAETSTHRIHWLTMSTL